MDTISFIPTPSYARQFMARFLWPCMIFSFLLFGCGGGGQDAPSTTVDTTTGEAPHPPAEEITPAPPEATALTPFILPFDTTDSSVILRSSLTSAAAIESIGGTEEATSTNEYDATLGMKPGAIIGGTPGARFSLDSIPALADVPSGQLSIEVERAWLGVTNAEVRSAGYSHSTEEHLLSHGNGTLESTGRLALQPDQQLTWTFKANEGTRSSSHVNTSRSHRFARITISWTTSSAELYVDGLRIRSLPRSDPASDRFATIHIGNLMGTGSSPFNGQYYIRNLIVSTKPVTITATPLLSHIMHIGDSFAAGQPFFNIASKYDGTIVNTVIKELVGHGAGFDRISVFSNGGGQIQDNGIDPLELDVGQSMSRSDALTQNPSLVVFITGGNDTSIFESMQFANDLHDHVEAFLGANGHPATTTQHVIVTTTTSNLNATHPATLGMRQIMLDLPTWWDSTYPGRAGAITVVDTWTLFGGPQVDSTLFGAADPVHPAASGNIVYGQAIAKEIIRLLQDH